MRMITANGMSALRRMITVACIAAGVLSSTLLLASNLPRGDNPAGGVVLDRFMREGLGNRRAFGLLTELIRSAPNRLSGSAGADAAVRAAQRMMRGLGFTNIRTEPVMVPHWERGRVESAVVELPDGKVIPMSVCALGGSIATPSAGIAGTVIEVHSLSEAESLGTTAKGKIVFFNRPMDPGKFDTFDAYGGAVDQRSGGAVAAARAGAVAVLVRSMTLATDGVPHTGGLSYDAKVRKIPAAAISTRDADMLSELLKAQRRGRVRLKLSCRTLEDAPSANVMGEIVGSEHPEEVIVIGGHLDCWDKGNGAHDDGSGCAQALEALDLIRRAGLVPQRTIRAVLFMNEENGLRGGHAYAAGPHRAGEKHVAVIESDRGGFAPRGFTVDADSVVLQGVNQWAPLFELIDAGIIRHGGSGADISPLVAKGVPGFGLFPESQRYFDYHHSANDTLDKVNPRELELGAIAEALLAFLISEKGL